MRIYEVGDKDGTSRDYPGTRRVPRSRLSEGSCEIADGRASNFACEIRDCLRNSTITTRRQGRGSFSFCAIAFFPGIVLYFCDCAFSGMFSRFSLENVLRADSFTFRSRDRFILMNFLLFIRLFILFECAVFMKPFQIVLCIFQHCKKNSLN